MRAIDPWQRLDPYLDGELAPEERNAFERELERSPRLRKALDERRALDRDIRSLPALEPSPQFEARLWARLARAENRTRGGPILAWIRGYGAVLAGPVLAALALFVLLGNPSLPQADWELLADAEGFEIALSDDAELVSALDILVAWDEAESL